MGVLHHLLFESQGEQRQSSALPCSVSAYVSSSEQGVLSEVTGVQSSSFRTRVLINKIGPSKVAVWKFHWLFSFTYVA